MMMVAPFISGKPEAKVTVTVPSIALITTSLKRQRHIGQDLNLAMTRSHQHSRRGASWATHAGHHHVGVENKSHIAYRIVRSDESLLRI